MQAAGEPLEDQFRIRFESFTVFPQATLSLLHSPEGAEDISEKVTIVSASDASILSQIQVLSEVANCSGTTLDRRRRYYEGLKMIYSKLPFDYREKSQDAKTLFVGIEREGRILAEAMGCLPLGHSVCPHAKRVPFEGGLEIGITGIPELPHFAQAVIIDGAIASGATLIAMIGKLRHVVSSFHILSAHATWEGLRAICRYCAAEGLEIQIQVGHATTGINDHFYAVQSDDAGKLVVGDLGDTISDLESERT